MVDIPTVNKQTRTKDEATMVCKSTQHALYVWIELWSQRVMSGMSKGAVEVTLVQVFFFFW